MADIEVFDRPEMERIVDAVRNVESTQRNLFAMFKVGARRVSKRHPPIFAKTTTNTDNATYPTAPANVFVVKPVAIEFTATVGNQTITTTVKAGEGHIARTVTGEFLPENTIVEIERHNRLWWITEHYMTTRYRGLINDASGFATSDPTTAMDGLIALNGMGDETSLATVYNIHGWAGDDNANARAEWNAEDGQWELYMVDCQ